MQKKYFNPNYWLERSNEKRLREWEKEMEEQAEWEAEYASLRIQDVAALDEYFRKFDNDLKYQTMEHKTEHDYEPSETYVKGFNEGYSIAKYLPEIAENLSDVLGNSERAKGFQLGRQEYLSEIEMEKVKDREMYPEFLLDDFQINRDDMEKEIDKDEVEPEID